MVDKILCYLRRVWYRISPKLIHIEEEDYWYEGEHYMYLLSDDTLLKFEDFDAEQECFRYADGSRYYPIMEVKTRDAEGNPVVWETVAFVRK